MSPLMQPVRQFPFRRFLAPLMIFLGTLCLRLIFVGGPPRSDEGIYAFNAEMVWRGARAFSMAPINLYPPLVRWVGMPPSTPLLAFRIADAFIAAGAAVMLFVFLSQWTESLIAFVIASAWSLASNQFVFIDAGFKNSIMAATLVYLGALTYLSSRSRLSPFWAGLLIPVAVFLREPFFPILIVSLCLTAALHGRRGIMIHVAGLGVAGFALLLWLYLFRGPPSEILGYYLGDMPKVYAAWPRLGTDTAQERWLNLRSAFKSTIWLLPPALLGVGWLLAPGRGERVAKWLALLLFLPPLYEIFAKLCLPYHWAQLLLGIAFLGAMGLRWLSSIDRSPKRWLTIGGFAVVAWFAAELDGRATYRAYRDGFRRSREFAPVMVWGRWDDTLVERSLYLEVARYIRDMTTADDRIVVSGYHEILFPMSGRLPPSAATADLTIMSELGYPERRPDLMEMLRRHPPRLVYETFRFTSPVPLTDFWPDFERRYRLARTFPKDSRQDYGFGARVWELKE
jgi:hypothetical protein